MQISLQPLVLVYLAFAVKQLLADYFLQSSWMVCGKGERRKWAAPLLAHAGIHAAITLLIVLVASPALWWLALVDFVVHACVDRAKGIASRHLPMDKVWFWRAFGIDQAAHQLTHFAFVLMIVSAP